MAAGSRATESERLARAALSRISEPGQPAMTQLVAALGAREVHARLSQQAVGGELAADLAQRLATGDPEADLQRAAAGGIRFVVPGDSEWPAALDDLANGPELHRRGGVPLGLWVRGAARLDELTASAVAVVGSRSATSYGADVAGEISATVGAAGYTVVSGAAFGIDQAAHRGALAVQAPTIAILACGADRAYPSAHRRLIDYIAEVGLVASEAAPGCAPTRIRFLARNRLIAAMSRGTVVVEAAIRSGALNTASWCSGLGRILMGVPGPVTSAPSAGVHQMIRSRDALLVTRGAEVLEAVGEAGRFLLAEPREETRPRDLLSPVEQQVLDAVPVVRAVPSGNIARTAGIRPARVLEALSDLADRGLVVEEDGGFRVSGELHSTEPAG